jgi:hypothetical protein
MALLRPHAINPTFVGLKSLTFWQGSPCIAATVPPHSRPAMAFAGPNKARDKIIGTITT